MDSDYDEDWSDDEERFADMDHFSKYWDGTYPDDKLTILDHLSELRSELDSESWDIQSVCNCLGLSIASGSLTVQPHMEAKLKVVNKAPEIRMNRIFNFMPSAKKTLETSPLHFVHHYYDEKLKVMLAVYNSKYFISDKKMSDDVVDMITILRYRVSQYITIIRGFLNVSNTNEVVMTTHFDLSSHSNRHYLQYSMPDKQRLLMWFIYGALANKKIDNKHIMTQQTVMDYGEPVRVDLPGSEIDVHERITVSRGPFQGCHGYVYDEYVLVRKDDFTHRFQLSGDELVGCPVAIPLSDVRVTSFKCFKCNRSEGYHMRIKENRLKHAFCHTLQQPKTETEFKTHVWGNGMTVRDFITEQCASDKKGGELFNIFTQSTEVPKYLETMLTTYIAKTDVAKVDPDKNYYAFINGILKRATTENGITFEPPRFYPYRGNENIGDDIDVSKYFHVYYDEERYSDDFVLGYSIEGDPQAREFYVPNYDEGTLRCVYCDCAKGEIEDGICPRTNKACCFYHDRPEKIRNIPTPYFTDIFDYQDMSRENQVYIHMLLGRLLYDCTTDHFEIALFIKGAAQSGKSVINFLLESFFADGKVGSAGATIEAKYPLADLYDKEMVCFAEVDETTNKNFNQMLLQKMISGERVSVTRKYEQPFTKYWTAPLLFTANSFLKFKDNYGSILRRFVTIHMSNAVDKDRRDGNLLKKLREQETPAILTAFTHAYTTIVASTQRSGDIYNVLPEYFHQTRLGIQGDVHVITKMFQSGLSGLIKGPHLYMKFEEFTDKVMDFGRKHSMEVGDVTNPDYLAFPFKINNIRPPIEETRLYPPIADEKSIPMPQKDKYIVGVGLKKYFPETERTCSENVLMEEIELFLQQNTKEQLIQKINTANDRKRKRET